MIVYPGQMLTLRHSFFNPDVRLTAGIAATTVTSPRFQIFDPSGRLFADSSLHTPLEGASLQSVPDVLPGQLLEEEGGTYLYLLTIPYDQEIGSYEAHVSGTIDGYPITEELESIYLAPPVHLSITGDLRRQNEEVIAYSVWFHTTTPTLLRLCRDIYTMIQADQTRRQVLPGEIFALARHESGEQTDLLPLSSFTLQPGWTKICVHADLFMLPAVDRAASAQGYSGGMRYANPYYGDQTIYSFNGYNGQSPFANTTKYGPGPVFYLYQTDYHWGCRAFLANTEDWPRMVADSSGTALAQNSPQRLGLVCRPDFQGRLDYYARAMPAEAFSVSALINNYPTPDYLYAHDSENLRLNYNPDGPGPEHQVLLPEFCASGLSGYYKLEVAVTRNRLAQGNFNRFVIGQDRDSLPADYPGPLSHLYGFDVQGLTQ